jgi:hypothetical protein
MKYDPLAPPDREDWLNTPEAERLRAIESYHRIARSKVTNLGLHAALHGVVENQLAADDPAVCGALARLVREGLDRHEAMHAIASVLAKHIFHAMHGADDTPGDYTEALGKLTAAAWRASGKRS